jgi:hypothetical protein
MQLIPISCRYRGDWDNNDVGLTVTETDPSFAHWGRLWSIYHNKQLLTTFRELAWHMGLKVHLVLYMGFDLLDKCSFAAADGDVNKSSFSLTLLASCCYVVCYDTNMCACCNNCAFDCNQFCADPLPPEA